MVHGHGSVAADRARGRGYSHPTGRAGFRVAREGCFGSRAAHGVLPVTQSSSLAIDEQSGNDWARRRRLGQPLGRYVLGTLLGAGGAASVYMARLDGPHG